MMRLKETLVVSRPVRQVFDYVSDFRRIEQWDPGVAASTLNSPGHSGSQKVGMGSIFNLTLKFGLSRPAMTYVITGYDPPHKVVLKGEGSSFSAVDTICFKEMGGVTRITYQADITFSGAGRFLELLLQPLLIQTGKNAMKGLARQLDAGIFRSGTHWLDFLADHAILPGMMMFSRYGYMASRRFWTAPKSTLYGKKIVLTGGTSGIGRAAAFMLAEQKAFLTIVARNREKAEQVCEDIIEKTGNPNVDYMIADLSLLGDIRRVAGQIAGSKKSIDILINNAGALFNQRQETSEGLEMTFATDLLGVFALTELLLPCLARSEGARIINVSSGGMYTQGIDVNDLENQEGPYSGAKAYARAKRGLVVLTRLWAQRLCSKGIRVHAMHPGWVDTPGIVTALPEFHSLTKKIMRTPEQGADTMVWLAGSAQGAKYSGQFWLDRRPKETIVFPGTNTSDAEAEILYQRLKKVMES
jgi:NAD(P)-dependent dehydrogenase (short-subunit alcohol dehydrogenase family)/carbon monoxide dehydrogenase subunit G